MSFENTVRFLAGRLGLIAFALLFTSFARGAQPTPDALRAWQAHVSNAKAALEECTNGRSSFLLIDQDDPVEQRVRNGRIVVMNGKGGGLVHVPDGLIHDATGMVFIPGARGSDAVAVMQDYKDYAATYGPEVVESELIDGYGNEFRYQLKFQENGFGIKTGLLVDFHSTYRTEDSKHGYSTTESTHVVELDDPGSPNERELSPEEERGFVQRMFTIVRYTETDGGVLVEVESMSLSRDIPSAVRWFVGPVVERFSRQVLTTTLEKLRARVLAKLPETQARLKLSAPAPQLTPVDTTGQ